MAEGQMRSYVASEFIRIDLTEVVNVHILELGLLAAVRNSFVIFNW